jgi:hypothetical protein
MAFFNDANEVDKYIGGVFRLAGEHAETGPKLRAADIVLRAVYTDPECEMHVIMREPEVQVIFGPLDEKPDVTLSMPADIANKFWRGEYNMTVGMAKGEVKAKGPVNKILKLIPIAKPIFPMYRELVADKG